MVARVRTVAFHGVEVLDVETQVTIVAGLPSFTVVGLPDKAVAESRERVRAALSVLGLALPPRRITVNLSPADVLKEGSHFDLPIALGLLGEMGVLPQDELAGYTALGEVALDGSLTGVPGVLLAALSAAGQGLALGGGPCSPGSPGKPGSSASGPAPAAQPWQTPPPPTPQRDASCSPASARLLPARIACRTGPGQSSRQARRHLAMSQFAAATVPCVLRDAHPAFAGRAPQDDVRL